MRLHSGLCVISGWDVIVTNCFFVCICLFVFVIVCLYLVVVIFVCSAATDFGV